MKTIIQQYSKAIRLQFSIFNFQFSILLFLLLGTSAASSAQTPVPDNEYLALVALYNSTNGPGWTKPWNTATNNLHLVTWNGVTVENGHITALDLRNNYLRGTLPVDIKDLTQLKTLYLQGNQLSGDVPEEWLSLTELATLDMSYNQFAGKVPAFLHSLPGLKYLSLTDNQFDDIQTGGFASLTSFNLIRQTINQDTFYYRGNNIQLQLPNICRYNASKKDLSATNNFYIRIDGNTIESLIQATANGILTIPASYFKNLRKGQKITIYQSDGSASATTIIYQTTDISLPPIPQSEYDALLALYEATTGSGWYYKWDTSNNNFNEGSWYGVSVENGHITAINLTSNTLKGNIPSQIKNLIYLKEINFSGNNGLAGNIPATLGELTNMETLNLSNCQLSGNISTSLGNLSKLQTLNLSNNKFAGNIPSELGNLNELVTLNISSNTLSGSIPASLNLMTKLKTFYASYNALENLSPGGFGSVTAFSIDRQSLSRDTFRYTGTDLTISIPEICRYNFTTRDFSARNTFNILIDGNSAGSVQAEANGTLTIPSAFFKTLRNTQKVTIQQNGSGSALLTTIAYRETKIQLPSVPQSEYEALIALYNATTGSGWYNKWNVGSNNLHEGSWYGVSVENGHITALNLINNNLRGNIPLEIKNLTHLKEINLAGNYYLTGNIPAALGELSNLENLTLNSCQFTGEIPAALGNLFKLQTLILHSNKLTGNIPAEIGNLSELITLNIGSNTLSGSIPASLNLMPKLKSFYAPYNALENLSPGGFPNTTTFSIERQSISRDTFRYTGNDVTINLPEIFRYNFETRDFSARNTFGIQISSNSVGSLQAEANGTLIIPATFLKSLRNTQKIVIQQNGIGKTNYSTINYQETKIRQTPVPQSEYEALMALYNATTGSGWYNKWDITSNNLSEGNWYGISTENGHITSINLSSNNLRGSIPSQIKDLVYLKELILSNNSNLAGNIPASISELINLETLSLHACQLSGEIPAALGNLNKLQILSLDNNKLTENIPAELGNLSELLTLNIHKNEFSGSIPGTLNLLPKLKTFNASYNALENLTAGGFGNVTSFSIERQSLSRDTFRHTGNDVIVSLPEICRYNFNTRDFSGKFSFQIQIAGTSVGDVQAADNGTLTIPANYLKALKNTQKVSIFQIYNGNAYFTTISYQTTDISLPQIPASEYEALKALYNATAGFNWKNKWDVSKNNIHEGNWYGIAMENGHITEIRLPDNNLRGTIPAEIQQLPFLKVLDLSGTYYNKYITGSIPAEIGTLVELETLNLSYQLLSDTIPAGIGRLSKLVTLNLRNNQLTGNIPGSFTSLNKVDYLYLNENRLSGISAALPYRSSVQINLNNQQIQEELIFIAGNEIIYSLPAICLYDHTALTFKARNNFDIKVNETLKGTLQASTGGQLTIPVGYFSGITHTDKISITQKNGTATGSIITFSDYDTGTPVSDTEYQALIALYNATGGSTWKNKWNISQNNLHESFWYGVTTENGHITKIKLNGNNLQGSLTEDIQQLPYLKELNLSDNQLAGNIPSTVGYLTNLTTLDLHNNRFDGSIPENLGNLSKLTALYLYKNRLTGNIPQAIATITALKDLQVHNNLLSGNIPAYIGSLNKLTVLNLSNNDFYGDVPQSLSGLSLLISLDLSFNRITSLPASFNYGTGTSINLSNQQYEGESLLIDGTEVVVTLPNIATYNPETRQFNARNNFTIRLKNTVRGTAQANVNGTLTFPGSYLEEFQEGDTISLIQYSGIGYGSVFSYYMLYNTTSTPIPQSEYEALKALFDATAGSQWKKTWNTANNNIHEGRWTGVSFREGHVTGINLPGNGLKGKIPATLSNLPELTSVNLSGNELKGSIPKELNNLSKLESLNLSGNALDSIDVVLPAKIILKIGNQTIDRGSISLHKNTRVKAPKISIYNHESQTFVQQPSWMIAVNSKTITSIGTASNGEFALTPPCGTWSIHPGDTLQFRQMSGNAAGSVVRYLIDTPYGDTNVDHIVNILDVQHALNRILGSNPCPFNAGTADVNKDGSVNILDLVGTINIIQSNALLSQSAGLRSAGHPAILSVENGAVYLDSPEEVAAFDIRIQSTGKDRPAIGLSGFSSYIKETGEDQYSIMLFSVEGNIIPAGKTRLFGCSGNTCLLNAILANKEADEILVRIQESQTPNEQVPVEAFRINNHPNPFRNTTTFVYTLPETVTGAQITIRNQTGTTVEIIREIPGNSGRNQVEYTPESLPAGIYFYTFEANSASKTYCTTNKLMIVK